MYDSPRAMFLHLRNAGIEGRTCLGCCCPPCVSHAPGTIQTPCGQCHLDGGNQLYKESGSKGDFSQKSLEREICHNNKLSNYYDILSHLVSGVSNSLLLTVEWTSSWSHTRPWDRGSGHWLLPCWCTECPGALPLSDVWLSSELRLAF